VNSDPTNPPKSRPQRRTKYFVAGLAIIGVILTTGLLGFFRYERRAEPSIVAQGRDLVVANGCYACHGTSESDPRANLRQTGGGIWKAKAIPSFWENGIDSADVLIEWITRGVTKEEAENHKRLFIQMPAYERHMEPGDIESAAAWILAEAIRLTQTGADSAVKIPEDPSRIEQLDSNQLMVIGDRLSRQHACYQCHGELGQGGVANPGSFKNTIPGFFGRDFLKLTDGGKREEILHWIDHGRGGAIEKGVLGPLAKRYLDGQVIGMPAYKDQLSQVEKTILTEYLLLLNKEGPLTAKKLEALLKLLNEQAAE
jgi:mono/diheme cytochrome c family protein